MASAHRQQKSNYPHLRWGFAIPLSFSFFFFFFATEFAAPHICALHLLLSLVRGILFACCLHMVICGVGRGRDSNSISISTCCEKALQQNIKNKQNIRAQSTYNRGQWTNGHVCTLYVVHPSQAMLPFSTLIDSLRNHNENELMIIIGTWEPVDTGYGSWREPGWRPAASKQNGAMTPLTAIRTMQTTWLAIC